MTKEDQTLRSNKQAKKSRKRRRKRITLLAFVLLVAAVAFLGNQYQTLREENKRLSDPEAAQQAEVDELVAEVGKLVELPSDEQPTVATVRDVSKLQSQKIFAKAQNGDKVLIYINAKQVVIYRPSEKKIVVAANDITIGQTDTNNAEGASSEGVEGGDQEANSSTE